MTHITITIRIRMAQQQQQQRQTQYTPIPTANIKFLHPKNNETNFGIYNFQIEENQRPIYNSVSWVVTIDISGSMSNICSDGKSKMEQIKFTLKKMIKYFVGLTEKYNIKQTITLILFDDQTTIVSSNEEINEKYEETFNNNLINKLRPHGMTNIGAALDTSADFTSLSHTDDYSPANRHLYPHKTIHIFLTDGEITHGETDHETLKQKIVTKNNVSNIFLGFGTKHSEKLLRTLASTPNSEYYFIESLEKAGMVYGEVIYNRLYEAISNLVLNIENAEFYDYKTNSWTKTLDIGNVAYSANKTWHIRTPAENKEKNSWWNYDNKSTVAVNRENIIIMASFDSIVHDGVYYDKQTDDVEYPQPDTINKEVEKFWWRQKTQELMAETRKHLEENKSRYNRNNYLNLSVSSYFPPSAISYDSGLGGQQSQYDPDGYEPVLDTYEPVLDTYEPVVDPYEAQQNSSTSSVSTPSVTSATSVTSTNHEAPPTLLQRLDTFLTEMKTYIETNDLETDSFMKNLCDDIYVCIKGMNSPVGSMFVAARENSQGYQRSYNITGYEELENYYDGYDSLTTPSTQGYVTSSNYTTAYTSPMATQVMNDMS